MGTEDQRPWFCELNNEMGLLRVVGCAEHAPLAKSPNVVLTPHIGVSTVDTQREIGEQRN